MFRRMAVKGERCLEAFVLFEGGTGIGMAAKRMKVSYSTARVWWLQWKVAALEEEIERLKTPASDAIEGNQGPTQTGGT